MMNEPGESYLHDGATATVTRGSKRIFFLVNGSPHRRQHGILGRFAEFDQTFTETKMRVVSTLMLRSKKMDDLPSRSFRYSYS